MPSFCTLISTIIQVIKQSTCLSLIYVIVTYVHLACTSVHYERKMHVLIIGKQNFRSKKISCVLISLKYELYEVFYTEIFQIYNISMHSQL